ncbi:MAG TPA: PEP-CTERM sorting domain-containing protein, partial [Bryobacteraceae bacterium]
IHVTATPGLLGLLSGNQLGLGFSSAICGNDVLIGTASVLAPPPSGNNTGTVPEPGTLGMFAVGILLVGCGVWRRKGKA